MCGNQNSGGRRRRRRRAGWAAAPALAAAAIAVPAQATELDRKALADALDDEYRAEASYQAVIDKFGPVRPFINIIEAEKRHSSMVRGQYARLGMSAPENPYLGKLKPPASLLEACEQGVEAEIENIALYDRLLPKITDPAVRQVLSRLQAASRDNHLPAFKRCVARGGTPGRGPGGGGAGWQ